MKTRDFVFFAHIAGDESVVTAKRTISLDFIPRVGDLFSFSKDACARIRSVVYLCDDDAFTVNVETYPMKRDPRLHTLIQNGGFTVSLDERKPELMGL